MPAIQTVREGVAPGDIEKTDGLPMAKVAHITTVHQPNDVRIFQREASMLAARGYEVTLIACAERSTQESGVRIRALRRPRTRLVRMTLTAASALRAALQEKADLYHFHDPELIPVGLVLKVLGKRVVYDVHEDAAKDVHDKMYLPAWSRPIVSVGVSLLERASTRFFDGIVAATVAIAARHRSERTILLRNVPKIDELSGDAESSDFSVRPRAVAYVGGLAPLNGIEQMILAMHELPQDSGIRLLLGGRSISEAEDARLRALPGSEHVDFLGWVDREELRRVLSRARAGLVIYQPTPNIMECEPNKFYEMLSAGLPLIVSDLPHWRAFVDTHACGIVVSPTDPGAIARAILSLVGDPARAQAMGARGRRMIEREYNWEAESSKLLELYADLLGASSAVRAAAIVGAS